MSKVDPTQDYYGALEVNPDAGEDEIRKQYYRLARKYHPDRNPGKEIEFQPRFQQIQAAHECLMDPEQRRKYDLSRKRGTGAGTDTHSTARPGPSGQRGNPYKAHSSFPPPPRPPGAPPRKSDAPQPPPRSSGAARYQKFSYPPPPRRAGDDAQSSQQSRADVWTAWQKMNSAQNARNARSQPYHPTARADADAPGSQRSAYDAVNGQQRANTRPVPPRPRFGKAQTSVDGEPSPRTRDRPFGRSNPPRMNQDDLPPRSAPQVPPRSAPTASRQEGTSNGHAPSASADDYDKDAPFTENLRERTPYATQPGERTSFFGGAAESIRRTRSVKDATKLHSGSGVDLDSRFNRHRSLSPTSRADSQHSNDPQPGASRSTRPMSSRQSSGQPWLQYSSSSTDSEGDHVPARRRTYAATSTAAPTDQSGVHHSTPASPALNKSKSDDGNSSSSTGLRSSNRPKARQRKPMFDVHSRGGSSSRSGSPGKAHVEPDNHFPPSGMSTPGFSPTAPVPQSAGTGLGIQPGYQQMPPPPPPPPPPQTHPAPEDGQSPGLGQTFRPEGWQKSFADGSWASQPAPPTGSKSTSPTRPASNTARRVRTAAGQANPRSRRPVADPTADEVQERLEKGILPTRMASAGDEDAMDIDEPPPATSRRPSVVPDSGSEVSSSAAAHAAQHHISADPPRSGWGMSPSATHSRRASTHAQDADLTPASAQGPPLSTPARPSSNTLSMDSFRHVLPGPSNGAGMRNLEDLSATLPFESRAAATLPLKAAEIIAGEQIPRPPLAPLPPSTFTQQTWDAYLASMGEYITKWNAYNMRMVAHFQDRCVAMAEFGHGDKAAPKVDGPSNAVVHGWLGAVGETNSQKGWASYVQQQHQDDAWRKSWDVACDRHAEAIDKHGAVRERLLARGC